MMDELLRAAFDRHEEFVPVAADLRPAIAAGARRRRARRRWAWSGGALLMLALLAVVPQVLPLRPPAIAQLSLGDAPPAHPMQFLLLGTDRKPGAVAEPVRADAIVLLHVDPATRTVYQISIPGDLLLDLPGFGTQKASAAFLFGGYSLTAQAVTGLTGIPIDGGAVVDFEGMQTITKAAGGVELCVDERAVSTHVFLDSEGRVTHDVGAGHPVVYEVGCRHFAAWEALDYLRLGGTSEARDRHLRQYLAAMVRQLSDPVQLSRMIPVASGAVDLHLGDASLATLASAAHLDPARVLGVRLPTRPGDGGLLPAPGGDGLYTALRTTTVPAWLAAHPEQVG